MAQKVEGRTMSCCAESCGSSQKQYRSAQPPQPASDLFSWSTVLCWQTNWHLGPLATLQSRL